MNDTVNAALDYVQRGFALTWMEHGTKRPTHPGWNTPENVITTSEQVRRKFGNGQALNIGLVHQFGTPRTCSLDVDQLEYTRLALAEVGIDLDTVRQGVPCVVGNPKGFRLEYRQPDGEPLPLRKLQWTDKSGRKIPVFELRAGANHDCLPPSLHPSGKLYEWTTPLPVDPAAHPTPNTALLEIWRNWSAWEPVLQAASPWAQTPEPAPRSREARADVIGAFNKAHEVRQILEAHGYKPRGKRRYLPPNSTSGVPSVRILDSGMVFSDNGSCPLNDGRAHDAFDCYRILEHGGDFRAATKAAAELLGIARLNSAPTGTAQDAAVERVAAHADDAWPIPEPLPDGLPNVEPFEPALLPDAFRPWVMDIAERMQCPPDFPAVAAMVSLAATSGRRVAVRPKARDSWLVIPNLWGAAIGRPGIMKTPALQEPLKPLQRLEIDAKAVYADALRDYEFAQMIGKERKAIAGTEIRKAIKAKKDPAEVAQEYADTDAQPPTRQRFICNDATVEKLGELLNENPNGVLMFRDELSGFLRGMERDGQESARAFYLEAWDGAGRFTYDRIGRGTLDIEHACVSILGGIQPGPLAEYLHWAPDDGLMQRFQLAVWPDISGDWRNVDRWPDTQARNTAYQVFTRLVGLDPRSIGAQTEDGEDIPFMRFSPEAQEMFTEWRTALEMRLRRNELPLSLESHLAKYRKLVPALAMLIHLADNPQGGALPLVVVEQACAWAEYLESHAARLYSPATNPAFSSAHALADRLKAGALKTRFTLRDVYSRHWSELSTPELARKAVNTLVEFDWLRPVEETTGGRPRTWYEVNPRLKEVWP